MTKNHTQRRVKCQSLPPQYKKLDVSKLALPPSVMRISLAPESGHPSNSISIAAVELSDLIFHLTKRKSKVKTKAKTPITYSDKKLNGMNSLKVNGKIYHVERILAKPFKQLRLSHLPVQWCYLIEWEDLEDDIWELTWELIGDMKEKIKVMAKWFEDHSDENDDRGPLTCEEINGKILVG